MAPSKAGWDSSRALRFGALFFSLSPRGGEAGRDLPHYRRRPGVIRQRFPAQQQPVAVAWVELKPAVGKGERWNFGAK